jgi:hypothetical protein
MNSPEPLDLLPIPVLLIIFALLSLAAYEVGFQIGVLRKRHDPEPSEGHIGLVVGSILGLMAFLLGITMGMAADRFDNRRGLVLAETNAIGTAYLRAGYLSEPASSASQELLREYVPLRIASSDIEELRANFARSEEIQAELWTIAEDVARREGSDVVALYIESVNEVIDLHTSRFVAGIYSRVPATILWLLIGGVVLSLGLVGYNAGLDRKRNPLIAVVLILSLGAVMWLVIDLDRPRDGLLQTSQQPLIDLQERLNSQP